MAVNIFAWPDKRAMLESLAKSIFRDRTFLVRDIGPKFPEYAKELATIEADLTVAADKIYEIMMRSLEEEAEKYGRKICPSAYDALSLDEEGSGDE